MASMASCGQTTTLNEYEERITVILDTLKNDYYWQYTHLDLMGRIPTFADYANFETRYPFRVARDTYLMELDSLLDKNLSICER